MNAKVSFAVAGFACFALTGLATESVEEHGDCYYGDGACVGACARLYLASIYAKQGKASEAEKLKGEIRTQFPDAVTHKEKWGQTPVG